MHSAVVTRHLVLKLKVDFISNLSVGNERCADVALISGST